MHELKSHLFCLSMCVCKYSECKGDFCFILITKTFHSCLGMLSVAFDFSLPVNVLRVMTDESFSLLNNTSQKINYFWFFS